jgi:hypothetical protein
MRVRIRKEHVVRLAGSARAASALRKSLSREKRPMRNVLLASTLAVAAFGSSALAGNILVNENFDSSAGDWFLQGNQMLFPGGVSGNYLGIPLIDTFGVTLHAASGPLTGDLTQYAGLEFSMSMRTFAFNNFAGEPIDPAFRPLTLQFVDTGDPNDFTDDVSVYVVGQSLPQVKDEWSTITFSVPTTTGAGLPMGWGGTGDEDPNTFEPILPADRTFESVMQSVDEVRITTFQPGFFYGFSFYEVGIDNLVVRAVPTPGAIALMGVAGVGMLRRRRA